MLLLKVKLLFLTRLQSIINTLFPNGDLVPIVLVSDNIDDYYIVNKHTGETFPMFILVPCGKCELCRDKKSREWAFRAICENATSSSMPYFLTLTYNPKHLPKCGIFKEEMQLFFKRLRIKLDRLNISHNIAVR